MKKIRLFSLMLLAFPLVFLNQACGHIELFEKTVSIPGHAWSSDFKPEFEIEISDSTSVYKLFVVLRHTEKYRFNNLFINLGIKGPGQDSTLILRHELQLATNERWLGNGINDVYEHRIPVGLLGDTKAITPGKYTFSLQQIMREDPLENILDAGIRVEKK